MRSIIKSVIRIIVIFIFINTLVSFITSIISYWNRARFYGFEEIIGLDLALLVAAFLLSGFVLWVLWVKAGSLSRLLAGNIEDHKLVINTTNTELIRLALILIGVVLVLLTIPDLVALTGYHIRITGENYGTEPDIYVKANELKYWITAIAKIIIGLVLVFSIKKYWWKFNRQNRDKKNGVSLSRPFSITQITLEGFDPEKVYPVLSMRLEEYFESSKEPEEGFKESMEDQISGEIAFFLVGNDNGEFAWIAEDECRLAIESKNNNLSPIN